MSKIHLELDVEQFWRDDNLAHLDNCFNSLATQAALGIRMSHECVFAELDVEGEPWAKIDPVRQSELNKRYNDKAEKIVGKRLLTESYPMSEESLPYVKRIGEVFGGTYEYRSGSEWLTESVSTEKELEVLLEKVDKMNMREFMLPQNWQSEKMRIFETYGRKPAVMRHIRGPVTLACSIMGAENFIFLCMDEPDLAKRFSDVICRVILEMAAVMDEEAGVTNDSQRGFSFADDNCCLMTPAFYEMFGYPVLKKVFEHYSPDENDSRFQHSDSAMGHLLPILGKLNLTGVNFGPTVLVPEIRRHLPRARIDGCIAPLTFMDNDREALIAQVRRDLEDAKPCRGLNLTTAGSINNGSSLESMRLLMALIQNYGRY